MVRTVVWGSSVPLNAFDFSLRSPQALVTVWLYGVGVPRDVTNCHSVACPAPFILCVGFNEDEAEPPVDRHGVRLKFYECGGRKRLLGEIKLRLQTVLSTSGQQLRLYKATACISHCLPRLLEWRRTFNAWRMRRKSYGSGRLPVSPLESRCNELIFSCPRPVALVSTCEGERGSIFPVNLMGPVGGDYFTLALNRANRAGTLVEQAGRLVVSTVPFDQAEQVRQLGKNHRSISIDWSQLPFSTHPSRVLGIPVPDFALRVCEMKVEQTHPLGSHMFIVARILNRESYTEAPEFYRLHGLYAALNSACSSLNNEKVPS
jgi:flavin reductase (DIM6/NTAB) family NADH-FMN oxidoreductase RutF